jgi:rubrerythrin
MQPPSGPTVEQILTTAIQSEIDTRVLYQKIARSARDPRVRSKMNDLAEREVIHRARLERRYKEITGKVPPDLTPGDPDPPAGAASFDLMHALKFALEHERDTESDYRFKAESATNEDIKSVYRELAEEEWKHKREIEAEYHASLSPDQFFLDV